MICLGTFLKNGKFNQRYNWTGHVKRDIDYELRVKTRVLIDSELNTCGQSWSSLRIYINSYSYPVRKNMSAGIFLQPTTLGLVSLLWFLSCSVPRTDGLGGVDLISAWSLNLLPSPTRKKKSCLYFQLQPDMLYCFWETNKNSPGQPCMVTQQPTRGRSMKRKGDRGGC